MLGEARNEKMQGTIKTMERPGSQGKGELDPLQSLAGISFLRFKIFIVKKKILGENLPMLEVSVFPRSLSKVGLRRMGIQTSRIQKEHLFLCSIKEKSLAELIRC